jgi:hypothetical protein
LDKSHRKQYADDRQNRHQAPELDNAHLRPRRYC